MRARIKQPRTVFPLTEDAGVYSCGLPLIVRDAMNCLGAMAGGLFALTRPGSTALFRSLRRVGKKCLCPGHFGALHFVARGPAAQGKWLFMRFAARLRCPRLAPLISGRTLKSCPDTCLAVDAESFVTKRIRYHVASGLKSHPLQKRQRMGHPRDCD